MDENNRNFILAIVLSIGVLFAWQFFFVPKHPRAGEAGRADAASPSRARRSRNRRTRLPRAAAPQPGAATAATMTREEALAQSPRIAIDTPSLKGSIALKGGRIDDLTLKDYRETVEPASPMVVLLSPAAGPTPTTPSMASSARPATRTWRFPLPTRCGRRHTPGPLTPSRR